MSTLQLTLMSGINAGTPLGELIDGKEAKTDTSLSQSCDVGKNCDSLYQK